MSDVHGIVLLGGRGTRIREATCGNKHLLPIRGRPLADYGVELLRRCGATRVTAVVCPEDEAEFRRVFAGSSWAVTDVVCQPRPAGTAEALERCGDLVTEPVVLTLWGDNLFEFVPSHLLDGFARHGGGCRVAVTDVDDPRPFSTVTVRDGRVVEVIDEPQRPTTTTVSTGLMVFDAAMLFDQLADVPANTRGERDMMHVVRACLGAGTLGIERIHGRWFDAATSIRALHAATVFADRRGFNHSFDQASESSWTFARPRPLSVSSSTPPDAAS